MYKAIEIIDDFYTQEQLYILFDYTSNLRDIINLRANILKVKPNSLPKDGVVIDDKR